MCTANVSTVVSHQVLNFPDGLTARGHRFVSPGDEIVHHTAAAASQPGTSSKLAIETHLRISSPPSLNPTYPRAISEFANTLGAAFLEILKC
jgi:hypothetical protein